MNQKPLGGPTLQRSAPGTAPATATHGAATEQPSAERHAALLRQGAKATALSEVGDEMG